MIALDIYPDDMLVVDQSLKPGQVDIVICEHRKDNDARLADIFFLVHHSKNLVG